MTMNITHTIHNLTNNHTNNPTTHVITTNTNNITMDNKADESTSKKSKYIDDDKVYLCYRFKPLDTNILPKVVDRKSRIKKIK